LTERRHSGGASEPSGRSKETEGEASVVGEEGEGGGWSASAATAVAAPFRRRSTISGGAPFEEGGTAPERPFAPRRNDVEPTDLLAAAGAEHLGRRSRAGGEEEAKGAMGDGIEWIGAIVFFVFFFSLVRRREPLPFFFPRDSKSGEAPLFAELKRKERERERESLVCVPFRLQKASREGRLRANEEKEKVGTLSKKSDRCGQHTHSSLEQVEI
jgi:hypothetical protein